MQASEEPSVQWFVIVNPAAGHGQAGRRWPRLERCLRAVLPLGEVVFTTGRGSAGLLVDQAIAKGYRRLIAVGGDGTNHEVVNGIMNQRVVPTASLRYALLPVGTGNDWRRTHRIPRRLGQWLKMIEEGHTQLQDVGIVRYQEEAAQPRTRYFVNVAGLAYDAFVVRRSSHLRPWLVSPLIYPLLIIRFLFQYRPGLSRIRFNGQQKEDRFYTINAGIGRFSGGGMQLTPHANPRSGRLALTTASMISPLNVLLNCWRFYTGTIGGHPKVSLYQPTSFSVEPLDEEELLLEADGEYLGRAPATFDIIPQALCIIVPAN